MQKERIALFDNIKCFLIFSVVIGHFVGEYDSRTFDCIHLFIYAFHMPLFIYMSGLFHKNKDILKKVVSFTLISYFIVLLKYIVFFFFYDVRSFDPFRFKGSHWFAFALAAYIGMTYLLRKLDARYVLLFSFILSILAGFCEWIGAEFSLSRIIVFYPFYLLGTMTPKEKLIHFVSDKRVRIGSVGILLIWFLLCFFSYRKIHFLAPYFLGIYPYFGIRKAYGYVIRILFYLLSCVLGFCIMAIIPHRSLGYLTTIGERSLCVYIFHKAFIFLLTGLHVIKNLGDIGALGKACILLIAIATTFFFSLKPFKIVTDLFMKLPIKTKKEA